MQFPSQSALRSIVTALLAAAVLATALAGVPAVQEAQTPEAQIAEVQTPAESVDRRVQRLIEQLGDEDFFVRQRAQDELAKYSSEIFDALIAASKHEDLEIAARARDLLRSMEVVWTTEDDPPAVQDLLKNYDAQIRPAKLTTMVALTRLSEGAGLPALCRLVRYEKSSVLSREGALLLLERLSPDEEPPDQQANEKLFEKVRESLQGSRRQAAAWILTWLRMIEDPETVIADWTGLVEAEHALWKGSSGQTNSAIVARLVRFQIEWFKRLHQERNAVLALRRLIDLEKGSPQTLAQLLEWLIEQKAWEATDELVSRFAEQFADNPIQLYMLAKALEEDGDQARAAKTAGRALKLNSQPWPQQLGKHYEVARALRMSGQLKWARGEYRHVLDQGDAKNPVVGAALTEWLQWLVEQKAWQEIEELAAGPKFASRFAADAVLLYTRAQAQAEQGHPKQAEETARQALKLNPGANSSQVNKHRTTARTLRQRGLDEWARREYRHVLDHGAPDNAIVLASLKELLDWLADRRAWQEIDELAAGLGTRFADNALLAYSRAQARAESGDRPAAEKAAAAALELNPGTDDAAIHKHRTVAQALWGRRLFAWAAREYRYVLKHKSGDRDVLAELLDCLAAQKAWRDVDELAEKFPLGFAGSAVLLYTHAQAQAELGKKELAEVTALLAFKLDLGTDRERLNKHRLTAGVLRDRGLFDWSGREYRYVIDTAEADDLISIVAQSSLAESLHDQEKDLQAAKVAQKLAETLQRNPTATDVIRLNTASVRSRANLFLAGHWRRNNDPAKQREYLDKAIEADETDLDVLIACWRLPEKTPAYREKIVRLIEQETASLRKRIAKEPTNATAYNQFAWLAGNTGGNLDEALRCSRKSIQIRPDYGGYYDTLAHVYFARGDYENAVKTQAKAAELEPHSGLILRQWKVFRTKWEEEKKPR